MIKRNLTSLLIIAMMLVSSTAFGQYHKQTYKDDPMNVIHYTLDNGLQVYLSVNKDVPRIQTYIAVRVGSKNDPSESTGLSHYLEHLMFKGTTHFGTLDYTTEKQYLDQIEKLYEVYNKETDPQKRTEIYHRIDSVSLIASKYAIPNEYDKMMSMIGAQNTNAFTSNDMTVYQEDIPSNELERWLMIEGDRFANPVFRLFHTELEAVYEEKNMNMAKDSRTAMEQLNLALYPNHPYGTQTTIGTIEHLKNPSLENIKKHFETYYVPNNYCIAMSGDFDPEEAIKLIDKYFGKIQPKYIPDFTYVKEEPIQQVKSIDVYGLEAENLMMAYRMDAGNGSRDVLLAQMVEMVLNNGNCGLIDENINQKQLAQGAYAGVYALNDYSSFLLGGTPKQGQSLEELRDILLQQINILKSGSWDESLLQAAINNEKLQQMRALESNSSRAMAMVNCYLSHQSWQDIVNETKQMTMITKQDILDFANRIFKDNNYVIVYKRQGKNEIQKVDKPAITPVVINRDVESDFLKQIAKINVKDIEPVFVDFNKDMQKGKANSNEILYVKNTQNGRFTLNYRYDYGSSYDKKISAINNFTDYIESSSRTLSQINKQMYDIACSYSIRFGADHSTVSISGLSENMNQAIEIVEDIINNPKISEQAVQNGIADILKSRNDAKSRQNSIFQALNTYAVTSTADRKKNFVTNEEIKNIKASDVISYVKTMTSQPQTITYYGDMSLKDLQQVVSTKHKASNTKNKLKKQKRNDVQSLDNQVLFVNFDAKQSLCRQLSRSVEFNQNQEAGANMYNEYFGGSMNSIVFQEIREKRSLAYSAAAYYVTAGEMGYHNYNLSHIGTQNDKLIDALQAFTDLFDNMPISEQNFNISKQSLISSIRTKRTTKMGIINSYLYYKDRKLKDNSKQVYDAYQKMTLEDVKAFNNKYIKNQKRTVVVLGNEAEIDMKGLEKYGKVKKLTLEEVFGY